MERKCKEAKKSMRCKKRESINKQLDQIDQDRKEGRIRRHYLGIKKIKRGYQPRIQMVKDKNNKLITNPRDVNSRWKEYFEDLLNRPEPNQPFTEELTYGPEVEVPELSHEEVAQASKAMKNNKSPGNDEIPAEMWKYGGESLYERMYQLVKTIWNKEEIPSKWKESIVIPLHKKGDKMQCNNYRGISLLPTAYKIYTRVVYWRLLQYAEEIIGEYQSGFRPGRSTIDQVFVIRRLMESRWEFNRPMTIAFIDFKQAYDSIHRPSMWHIMKELGIPAKLIALVKACYNNTKCAVRCGGKAGEQFDVSNGLKQGCVLSPLLFNLMIEKIIRSCDNRSAGVTVNGENLNKLAYADDIALMSEDLQGVKVLTRDLKEQSTKLGLEINQDKTKIMTLSRHDHSYDIINIDGMQIETVAKFKYLGSSITDKNVMDHEITERLGAGNKCFYSLLDIFKRRQISRTTKLRIYNSIVRPVVTYGCETWSLTEAQTRKLCVFERMVLRRIVGPKFDDQTGEWRRYHNVELRETTGQSVITDFIRHQRLKWAGHAARMSMDRVPRKVIGNNITAGHRPVGRPRKDWTRGIREDVAKCGGEATEWMEIAQHREEWRGLTRAVMGLEGLTTT